MKYRQSRKSVGTTKKRLQLRTVGSLCVCRRGRCGRAGSFPHCRGLWFRYGGQQHICGAVAGAVMVNGLRNSSGQPGNIDSLIKTLGVSRQLTEGFCVQNGTAICKELKGTETEKMIRSCPDCVMDAARLAEAILLENTDAAFQNQKLHNQNNGGKK